MRNLRQAALHPSLRIKLTLAFAAAMAVLLTGLGFFIYARLQAGLDDSLNQSLRSRTNDVRALVNQADTGLADAGGARLSQAGGGFAQVLQPGGRVLDQTPGLPRSPLLRPRDLARASRGALLITTQVRALGSVRLLATPVRAQDRPVVVLVGTSLKSRTAALDNLGALMLLGGPVALVLASLLGYGVSALSLRSVEAMRRRTTQLSVTEPGQRLPVPPARDELRRLALTLNEMLDRNDLAFARERRFVADASHELRSPLAILKTGLEIALDGEGSKQELRAALASADAETDRIAHLASDLLTLAQADEGRLRIEPAPLRASEAVERLQQRFAQRALAQERQIVTEVAPELIVQADPLRLEQALSNLLDNALRHGAGTVRISAARHDGKVDLHVTDDGPGLPSDFLPVAFERFTLPEQGRTSAGTGLGLAIVRSIAEAHGGEARIANRPGGGADVWIALPEMPDREAAPALRSREPIGVRG
jgi:two-component system, OmpR family, sensor kinase